jgi:hypothetical protein
MAKYMYFPASAVRNTPIANGVIALDIIIHV